MLPIDYDDKNNTIHQLTIYFGLIAIALCKDLRPLANTGLSR
jgi:hypothetical protein